MPNLTSNSILHMQMQHLQPKATMQGEAWGGGGGMPGLSKDETKQIITTIMSVIVYSHYVEAIHPGSFPGEHARNVQMQRP